MAGAGVLEARTIPVGELSGQGTAVVAPDLRHCVRGRLGLCGLVTWGHAVGTLPVFPCV